MKYPDILNPEISRIGTADSQRYNIAAGILISEAVRTCLGPRGMEKMYVDILGEETVTKHGGAFLRKVDVDHPAAKAVVDAVNTVDTHVGDGTVSAAVLMGALLEGARRLLALGISTASVIRGFETGSRLSLHALDSMGFREGVDARRRLVASCIGCKAISDSLADADRVTDMILEAAASVTDTRTGTVDVDFVKIEEKTGMTTDMELVRGTVLDKPADSAAMPHVLTAAPVLLLNDPLEASRTKTESIIEVSAVDDMGRFGEQEDADTLFTVAKVADSGARLVVSRKGIGELAQSYLARRGIITIRRAKYNDLWWLEKSTGAHTCSSVESISSHELGMASRVYQRAVGGDEMVFVESEAPGSVTLLLRAVSKRYLDEFHRTALNALKALRAFAGDQLFVYGGGSCEAALAMGLRQQAPLVEGSEQKAVYAFADALESIPATLARNAGMDVLDALPLLRNRCAAEPDGRWGIDAASRSVARIREVVDARAVKEQVIKSATEGVNLILNVDDVFMKDLIDNTHCHIDGTVHAHKDPGRNHNHWEQEGMEQRQMHQHY
ncbi:MAG: thermosome subunit [Thaumarchaeota archaeon]|nr:thermosome subunit [Nitrososphaerota archaeon]